MDSIIENGQPPTPEAMQQQIILLQTQLANLNTAGNGPQVNAARAPKIPPFLRTDPALWFYHAELALRSARITVDSTKLEHIVLSLGADFDAMSCIRDILMKSPRPDNSFDLVKERLIKSYSTSAEARLRQLLKGQVQAGGKPSLILSRLRNLNDKNCNDEILKTIFLDHLPERHRSFLATFGDTTLDMLAEQADKLTEFADISNP